MANTQPYLIFSLNESLYGIDAIAAGEIFPLPELTPVTEAPRDVVGVVNLRGDFLPVIDLNLRFGYRPLKCQVSDSIIVLVGEESRLGMIVNQVHEVENIPLSQESYGQDFEALRKTRSLHSKFIKGIAQVENDIVMLLDTAKLLSYSEQIEAIPIDEDTEVEELPEHRVFCPQATPEERKIFRQRADNLRQLTEGQDLRGFIPVAAIALNGEYFGIDLQMVREFSDIKNITPIPCCPSHIVGNMNLRGEIVTLVDIRGILNLSPSHLSEKAKATIVSVDDCVVGITVDEVFDVTYVNPSEIQQIPVAVHAVDEEYLQGAVQYNDKVVSILDLRKIFTQGNLVVEETV